MKCLFNKTLLTIVMTIAMIWLFIAPDASAAVPIEIENIKLNGQLMGKHIEYFEDIAQRMGIEDISEEKSNRIFRSSSLEEIRIQVKKNSAIWFRFTITNGSISDIDAYLHLDYHFIKSAELYIPGIKGSRVRINPGFQFSENTPGFQHRTPVFSITIKPGAMKYYMRIVPASINIQIPVRIWSGRNLINRIISENILYGIYLGVLMIIFFYNLFIYISTGNRSYIYLLGAIFLSIIKTLIDTGIGQLYLWKGLPVMFNLYILVILLLMLFDTLFIKSFLETDRYTPRINTVFKVFIGALSIFIVLFFIMPIHYYIKLTPAYNILIFVIIITALISAFIVVKKGSRSGIFFLVSVFILLLFFGTTILIHMKIIPAWLLSAEQSRFVLNWGIKGSTVITFTLLSLGLADKINIMKNELQVLNVGLEDRVRSRTIELSERNRIIEDELETARLLQHKLLPEEIPATPGFISHITYIPMDKVGGDFYDFTEDEKNLELFIADVSGHGLPGAFISIITKMALGTVEDKSSPARVLSSINSVIHESTVKSIYVTTFFCLIDKKTKMMRFSNGGHFPPFVYRKKEDSFIELRTKGTPLGWFKTIKIAEKELQLHNGDRLFLYTDGITECMDKDGEMFGDDRFKEYIRSHIDLSPEEFSQKLLEHLYAFSGTDEFDDDLCLMVLDIL